MVARPLRTLACAALAGAALAWGALAGAASPPAEATTAIVPGRLLVRTRSGALAAPSGMRPLRLIRRLTGDTHLVELSGASVEETRAAARALASAPDVVWAEPEHFRWPAQLTPDDPMFAGQWGLALARAPQAWSRTTGSDRVVVAIVDTGILPHVDLRTRLLPGYDFISDVASAGDGDGRDPDPTDAGTAAESSSGLHGIHITGIIGATANNEIGVSGVDWACRLLPLRVLGVQGGRGVDSDIADAIRWATGIHVDGVPDNATPAQVVNLSFSGPGRSEALKGAIDDAVARGAVVVAAAGNLGADATASTPGDLDHVIAVGAVGPGGTIAAYSNFGVNVALMAPGGSVPLDASGHAQGILSTLSMTEYVYSAGTSQAAAFVSGAAALVRALRPELSPGEVRTVLTQSANPSARCGAPGEPTRAGCGAGMLDIDAALALAASGAPLTDSTADSTAALAPRAGCAVPPGPTRAPLAALVFIGLVLVCLRAALSL